LPPRSSSLPRGIVNVTGQLYRAQNDNHYTVFLVTPEGVIMSDPINRDFSRWLKNEIATRFKVPVRYVLYTHRDWDHASGGVVFADTAQFVGHINMLAGLAPPEGRPPLPLAEAALDTNRNGVIERTEATGNNAVAQMRWTCSATSRSFQLASPRASVPESVSGTFSAP